MRNVEIIEFYPIERNESKKTLNGTIRVKLPDLGIYVSKIKDRWFFICLQGTELIIKRANLFSIPSLYSKINRNNGSLFKQFEKMRLLLLKKG